MSEPNVRCVLDYNALLSRLRCMQDILCTQEPQLIQDHNPEPNTSVQRQTWTSQPSPNLHDCEVLRQHANTPAARIKATLTPAPDPCT